MGRVTQKKPVHFQLVYIFGSWYQFGMTERLASPPELGPQEIGPHEAQCFDRQTEQPDLLIANVKLGDTMPFWETKIEQSGDTNLITAVDLVRALATEAVGDPLIDPNRLFDAYHLRRLAALEELPEGNTFYPIIKAIKERADSQEPAHQKWSDLLGLEHEGGDLLGSAVFLYGITNEQYRRHGNPENLQRTRAEVAGAVKPTSLSEKELRLWAEAVASGRVGPSAQLAGLFIAFSDLTRPRGGKELGQIDRAELEEDGGLEESGLLLRQWAIDYVACALGYPPDQELDLIANYRPELESSPPGKVPPLTKEHGGRGIGTIIVNEGLL